VGDLHGGMPVLGLTTAARGSLTCCGDDQEQADRGRGFTHGCGHVGSPNQAGGLTLCGWRTSKVSLTRHRAGSCNSRRICGPMQCCSVPSGRGRAAAIKGPIEGGTMRTRTSWGLRRAAPAEADRALDADGQRSRTSGLTSYERIGGLEAPSSAPTSGAL
jgi:hypothetical protein